MSTNNSKPTISLVSFFSTSWEKAGKRFLEQAKDTNLFYNIKVFTEDSLEKETKFFADNKEFIAKHRHGFGGWIWKPYIIEWAFNTYTDSDYIMYLDIGSEFNINEDTIDRFYDYVSIAEKDTVFGFRNRDLEQNLTHCSVIENIYSGAKDSRQFEANTLIFKNNKDSVNIVSDWLNNCLDNNYFNISPTDRYNCCEYWGGTHLHDQSTLSCILKKNKIEGISDEGSWYFPGNSISTSISKNRKKYPLFTARNPFEFTLVDKCLGYKDSFICQHSDNNDKCDTRIQVRKLYPK